MNIFPVGYFPPLPWFAAAIHEKHLLLEVNQFFRKQQITNRMHIRVANRVLPLTIPIQRRGAKVIIRHKRISYAENWPDHHWKSLQSAYANSPYFDYYRDELHRLYDSKPELLIDFLKKSIEWSCRVLGVEKVMKESAQYHPASYYQHDFRQDFDPGRKKLPEWFISKSYPQVFEGFEAGLSILDLLFNQGPESRKLLTESVKW